MGMSREDLMRRYQSDAAVVLGDEKKKKRKKKSGSSSTQKSSSSYSKSNSKLGYRDTGMRIIDEDDLFPSQNSDSDGQGGSIIQTTFASVSKKNVAGRRDLDEEAETPAVADFIDEGAIKGADLKKWKTIVVDKDIKTNIRESPRLSPKPAARQRHDSPDMSPPRRPASRQRHDSPDMSPSRRPASRQRHDSPDMSPPRRLASYQRHDSPDMSPPRRPASHQRHDSPDMSPPRRSTSRQRHDSPDMSPPRRSSSHQRHDSPDMSPPRRRSSRQRHDSPEMISIRKRGSPDLSPPRRHHQRKTSPDISRSRRGHSDILPTSKRTRANSEDLSPPRMNGIKAGGIGSKVMADGTKAGLVHASMVVESGRKKRENEDRRFAQLDEETLGRYTETVVRDKKTGRRLDPKLERLKAREAEAKKEQAEEAALRWGKGVKQEQNEQDKREEALKEMAKPFARYADDADLEDMLKAKDRAGDPMAHLVKKKVKKSLPVYKGPAPQPNRYSIWPGYRWDGVDRSNEFEKKLFTMQADANANASIAMAWSTEDM
eukprot:CFRG1787T1